MKKNILVFILMLISPLLFAQDVVKRTVKEQASAMVNAYAKGDYLTMARYTNRKVLSILGGPQKMAAALKTKMTELDKKGVHLVSADVGEVLQLVSTPTEMYCIIPQYIRMRTAENKLYSRSHLLGVSLDIGKTWTFLDANGQTPEMIKGIIPDLSKEIIIPKKEMKVDTIGTAKPVISKKATPPGKT